MALATQTHPEFLLRIGDSALVLAQQLSKWVGDAPTLEEELAMANTALDVLGQATLTLEYAASMLDRKSADELAFGRDSNEFRNYLLCEQPNGDFAVTMVRQLFYSLYARLLWQELAHGTDEQLAGIAAKAVKETQYHVEHVSSWFIRLALGTDESRTRVIHAIELLWPYTGELFTDDEIDTVSAGLRSEWLDHIGLLFERANIELPTADTYMHSGGLAGKHTEALGYILAEMQFLQRAYPGMTW